MSDVPSKGCIGVLRMQVMIANSGGSVAAPCGPAITPCSRIHSASTRGYMSCYMFEYRTLHVLVKRRQGSRDTHGTHTGHTYRYRRKDTWGSRDTHEHWSTRAQRRTLIVRLYKPLPPFTVRPRRAHLRGANTAPLPNPTVIRPPSRAELNELDDIRAPAPYYSGARTRAFDGGPRAPAIPWRSVNRIPKFVMCYRHSISNQTCHIRQLRALTRERSRERYMYRDRQ